MVTVFYILVLLMIFAEIIGLSYFEHVVEIHKRRKNKEELKIYMDSHPSEMIAMTMNSVIYMSVILIGLMSQQWPLFSLILILSLITSKVRHIKWIRNLDAIISIAILIFIVLNKFHFRLFFF
jgi:hypothetical protein